jgi:uncharacterized protein
MDDLDALRRVAAAATSGAEPAHDWLHVLRVSTLANEICATEGADSKIAVPAALLHELYNFPKNHPESARSGEVCAERAREVLSNLGWSSEYVDKIAYCIAVHGFSTGTVPVTMEAKVLQDADRLDAIGAIGIARCFATGAIMQVPFYDSADPFSRNRSPDDQRFSVDHFFRKLLKIPERLHTPTARRLAEPRVDFLNQFLVRLANEIPSTP